MKRILLYTAAMCIGAATAAAQDLSKEITVDRTVVPQEREAQRLSGINPEIISPQISPKTLLPTEYTRPGQLRSDLTVLSAAPWRQTVPHTPYRGYASIGYFPAYNLGASAGYRFISDERSDAGAWLNYNGCSYKGDDATKDTSFGRHFFTIGADGKHRFNDRSTLSADLTYAYSSVGHPSADDKYTQTANDLRFGLSWLSSVGMFGYDLGARVEYFGFGKADPLLEKFDPNKQTLLDFNIGAGLINDNDTDANRCLGIDINAKLLHTNNFIDISGDNPIPASATIALYHFNPYFHMAFGDAMVRLGLSADLSHVPGQNKFRAAPDVMLSYAPLSTFAAWLRLDGGIDMATCADMFAIDPYLGSFNQYGLSQTPLSIEGGWNIGPFSGFTVGVFGGYAKVNNWLMPVAFNSGGTFRTEYAPLDVKGWHAGAELAYEYKNLFKISAKAETAASSDDKCTTAWYQWRDRAKWAFSAEAEVTPTDPLSVTIGYQARTGRKAIDLISADKATTVDLDDSGNLYLGASYRITPQFTAFANAENLLGKRWLYASGVPSQGVKGLVGVAYKF